MDKKISLANLNIKELVKPRTVEEIYSNSKIVESLCRTRDGACRSNRDSALEPIDEELIF
ncbi:hypothetical protein TH53_23695 [Pedobacter lusitanus]|uniref:Uncharacterized protein n=1 Tax=Pedobacter lusitanus TaxID=1503925 RepID=A0A0D0GKI4_9SPHI|nr:hypothetical protein [Pedobacter lusitanus]KIO74891.1 hypothetical protein TH53_23695 [Pedobacter lusitanus]